MRVRMLGVAIVFMLFIPVACYGTQPLITDDTGTQGTGKYQIEVSYEHLHAEGSGATLRFDRFDNILTGGVTPTVDIILDVPALHLKLSDPEGSKSAAGLGDVTLETKWRFFESDGLSFAVKPGIAFPTGDDGEDLGAGELRPRIIFIATKDLAPFTFHANAGYTRNENHLNENDDIWHVSLAAEYRATSRIKLVANAGADGSHDRQTGTPERFVLGGVIFSATEHIDLDVGAKGTFADIADAWSLLAGVTYRF
ncbi:MAG: transporter [Syntrophobacteraceae bacterium]